MWTRKPLLLAGVSALCLVGWVSGAAAQGVTSSETLRDVFGGHLTEFLDPAPNPPYGNVVLWSQVDDTLYLSFRDLDASEATYEAYQDLTIMRVPIPNGANQIDDILDNNKITTPDQRLNLQIQGVDFSNDDVVIFGANRSIVGLNALRLRDVNLELDGSIRTNFSGPNQTLELANASLQLGGRDFGFQLDATPALITTRAGQNELINFSGAVFGGDLNLQVIPGTALTIRDTGENSATLSSGEALRLRSGVHNILVDNSTLAFEDTQAFFTNGQTTVQNGGHLDISGPQYTVQLSRIAIDNASLTVQRESELKSSLLELRDSTMTVGQGGVADAGRIVVFGTANQMIGEGSSRHGHINAPTGDLTLSSGSALSVENGIQFDLGVLNFADNTSMSLDDSRMDVDVILSASSASPNQFTLTNGSVVNVNQLISSSEAGGPTGAPLLQFDLSGASFLKLGPSAEVDLNFNTEFNLSDLESELNIEGGRMLGSGRITGLGSTVFSFGGIVDPTSLDSAYGRIAFDGTLALPTFSTYKVDIGVDPLTGTALNDVLAYGELVAIGRPDIVIYAKGSPNADELEGKTFTIIQADTAGVTGAGEISVLNENLIEDASVPALIDFFIRDLNTNGHEDVTLIALKQDVSSLTDHRAVRTENAGRLVQAITDTVVTSPVTGGGMLTGGSTISTALTNLTNGQLAQVNSIHAEPYSSFLTVGLERIHHLAGGVMDHAVGAGEFSGFSHLRGNEVRNGRFWGQVTGANGQVQGRNDLGSFGYQLGQFTIGMDVVGDADENLGFYLSAGSSSMDEHDIVNQELSSEDVGFGIYGHKAFGSGWQLTGATGVSFGNAESVRYMPATIGSFTGGTARSEFDTQSFYASARVHRAYELEGNSGGWTLYPSLGMTYAHTRTERITENGGGDFNYEIAPATAESFVVSPGIDFGRSFNFNGLPSAVNLSLHYEYDALAQNRSAHEIQVTSPLFGTFNQVGQNRGPHTIKAGFNGAISLTDNMQLGVGYEYSKHTHGDEHGVGFNLTATW